jgi:hypothetical protein
VLPFSTELTVYAGTEQGLYRGHLDPGGWSWTRAAGVPNVQVTDVRAHQSARFFDLTGIVRASTYGRGMYELRRSAGPDTDAAVLPLAEVHALRLEDDGAPSPVTIDVETSNAPFVLAPVPGSEISLHAPAEIRDRDAILSFVGWVINGKPAGYRNRISLDLEEGSTVVAYYELKNRLPPSRPAALTVALSANAQSVCVAGFSHEVTFSWDVPGGQPPVLLRADIAWPDGSGENRELKSINGSSPIPVDYPAGGKVTIRVIAEDSRKRSASAESVVVLGPCRPVQVSIREGVSPP